MIEYEGLYDLSTSPGLTLPSHSFQHAKSGREARKEKEIQAQKSCPFLLELLYPHLELTARETALRTEVPGAKGGQNGRVGR